MTMRAVPALLLAGLLSAVAACKPAPAPAPTPASAPIPTSSASAAVAPPSLGRGDKAPDFSLMGSDGETHTLAEHAGKEVVVLVWFPKAITSG